MVKINTGMRALLVGGKGGYVNSLVAQVVGISGKVVTVSANSDILDICKVRVGRGSPLARIMDWKIIENVTEPNLILESFKSEPDKFDAIIYCGAIPALPLAMGRLLQDGGCLIAPVQLDERRQQFQLLIHQTPIEREIRKITDFGVIFEAAK